MGRPVDIKSAVSRKQSILDIWCWEQKVFFFYPISRYMEWTGPARPDRNALWRLITQKVWKIETWNFNTIFIQHFNLCYQNLELISLTVSKLWSFPQGSNFVNFQQFFHHNFRLKRNFWILMVPSERSSWDLSEYTLFYIKQIFFHLKKSIFRLKM